MSKSRHTASGSSARTQRIASGGNPKQPPEERGALGTAWKRRLAAIALLVCAFLMGAAFWRVVFLSPTPSHDRERAGSTAGAGEDDPQKALRQLSAASQRLSEKTRRAVVRVEAAVIRIDAADDEIAQLFGSAPPAFGQGSGVIVDADGHLLTNYHVIRGAREISVVIDGTRRFPATVVGRDALTDLAVLKIEADGLDTIIWGDSNELQAGAFVWAIGCPFGLEGSVSFGIVSAKNRDTLVSSPFQAFLQTDAAVNPGNSGGPLVDAEGRVVGINTAILGREFQGISFAIPSNTAREIHQRLKQYGRVARGWLGISLDPLTEQRAAQLTIAAGHGVYVVSVARDDATPSPARLAGIRPGDVLTHWNGQHVDDPIQFSRIVAQSPVGAKAEVTVIREGRELKLPLVVGERPQ